MPQFVAPFIVGFGTAIGGAVGAFLVGSASFIASSAILLGGLALSASAQRSAKRKARDQFNAAQTDRLVNVSSTVAPRELVLGRVRKGGAPFFRASTGSNKTTFVMLIPLAGHEIDGVETIYFNDTPVTLDGAGNVTTAPYALTSTYTETDYGGTLTQEPIPGTDTYFTGSRSGIEGDLVAVPVNPSWSVSTYQYSVSTFQANVRAVLGTDSQAADAEMMALFPGVWTSAHRARGVAYLICRFEYSETAFPTGLPVVTATIRGAKCYDPRTGLTAWTDNPALHMRHVYQHAAFGKATVTAAEDARITTAANACDTSTVYTVGGAAQAARALYKSGIVASYGAAPKDLFDDLSQSMAGSWAFAGGELYMKAGTHTASVMSLSESDLAVVVRDGASESMVPISIAAHKERAQKFNTVNVQIWDAAQDYKQVTLTPLIGAALVYRDAATLTQAVTYAAIGYAPQALHVAGVMMRDARDPLTVVIPFKLKAYTLELFDTISLTISRYGWSAKLFTVLGREFAGDGSLKLTLKETAASIFTLDAAFFAQGGAANTSLPIPWYVAPITSLTVTSGTAELTRQADGTVVSRMRVAWPQPSDASIMAGTVEIQYRDVLTKAWTTVSVSGSETQALISDVADSTYYVIRARARNRLAVGDWGAQVVHQVIGKTEPPADVATFSIDGQRLSWSYPTNTPDLAGFVVRFNYGENAWWDGAASLHAGLVTDSPYTMAQRPSGTVTLLIKAVDTSRNYSANAAVIVVDLGDQLVENLFVSWPQAPTFSEGTIVGGSVVSGELAATATDLFYGPDLEPFYGLDLDLFYVAGTYTDMSYAWQVLVSATGTLLLDHDIAASNFQIEYQRDSQAAFYGPGADYFYSPDADPFYGAPAAWATWPGLLAIVGTEIVTLRISTAGGDSQGVVTVATPKMDVPDVVESFSDIVIAPGGTRLPITLSYRAIVNISLTSQADGNGGITARAEDKSATLGPLVKVFDASGTAVTGLIDADIQGY